MTNEILEALREDLAEIQEEWEGLAPDPVLAHAKKLTADALAAAAKLPADAPEPARAQVVIDAEAAVTELAQQHGDDIDPELGGDLIEFLVNLAEGLNLPELADALGDGGDFDDDEDEDVAANENEEEDDADA